MAHPWWRPQFVQPMRLSQEASLCVREMWLVPGPAGHRSRIARTGNMKSAINGTDGEHGSDLGTRRGPGLDSQAHW